MSDITLYFAQHGLAVDKTDDPARPLSEAGKKQTESIARILRDNTIPVSQIFHSGKLRASQTAEIFASALKPATVSSTDLFSPNDDVKQTAEQLAIDNALYVGHLPHLEKLVAYLICGDENINAIKFSNSGIICLRKSNSESIEQENNESSIKASDESGNNSQLLWFLSPALSENKSLTD